ncbi:MAG TPA: glycosyltransferase, partial [Candidatus Saccharimonadales bacterium]
MRIWLVGGGTAGHVSPLLALEPALKAQDPDTTTLVITDKNSAISQLMAGYAGQHTTIRSGKFRRYHGRGWLARITDISTLLYNLGDIIFFAVGFFQATGLALSRRPQVVFINGGAIGVPVAWVCRLLKLPYLIHESDTTLGLANRLIAKRAKVIASGFELKLPPNLAERQVVTGIPLREEFYRAKSSAAENRLRLGYNIKPSEPVVLVLGGSLGASRLNRLVLRSAESVLDRAHLIVITGLKKLKTAQRLSVHYDRRSKSRLHLVEFAGLDIADYIRLADLVISRAGATAIAEMSALKKPTILVPNSMLSGGHQLHNANLLAANKQAVVIDERMAEADDRLLAGTITSLLDDQLRRRQLAAAIATLNIRDSVSLLSELIIKTASG